MVFAFVFPGQGSQSVGMMAELAAGHDCVAQTFDQASAVLGFDLWERVQSGPREQLDQTEVTQPAMLTAGMATWRVWQRLGGPAPAVLAGHSLGEYTALVCAGAMDFADAVALVQFRGQAMQRAVPGGAGAMAAILGLEDEQVVAACAACSSDTQTVEAVNYNSPGQVVIAGHRVAVDAAITAARAEGARRAVLLPVSVPSHSSLMRAAAVELQTRLQNIPLAQPTIDVISTVDASRHSDPERIRDALGRQLYKPVQWVRTINAMIDEAGVGAIVECGPGKVLTGLNRRVARGRLVDIHALIDTVSINATLESLRES